MIMTQSSGWFARFNRHILQSTILHSFTRCWFGFAVLTWIAVAQGAQVVRKPDLIMRGSLTHADHETYREIPFTVPSGVLRITVEFSYTGREQHTAVDIGLWGPEGFRGWSGGDKHSFTVSASDATPSYLPGVIIPGVWKILLGVPNIRPGARLEYIANIFFDFDERSSPEFSSFDPVMRKVPGWYRGDLHMHSGHSDGSCKSQSGVSVPCPVFKTLQAAVDRKLDFIALTDHNTVSHFNALRELAPYFDRLLLLHGREITTFHGHANVYGTGQFVDFRVSTPRVENVNTLLQRVNDLGGFASINHPSAPAGEECMGCAWSPASEVDLHLMTAVEAINGFHSGIDFWQEQLNHGYRLTGIGGSDSHAATTKPPARGTVGTPTTVVYANELSESAILDGIRSGHVFIDVEGSGDRSLEFTAVAPSGKAKSGDVLQVPAGAPVNFNLRIVNVPHRQIEVIEDGQPLKILLAGATGGKDDNYSFSIHADGQRHWLRVNVRSLQGKLLLVGNPIYLNF